MVFDFFRKKKKVEEAKSDETAEFGQDEMSEPRESSSGLLKPDESEEITEKIGWLQKLKNGLSRTREKVQERVHTIKASRAGINEEFYDDILEVLLETDMGMEVAEDLIRKLRREVGARGAQDTEEACDLLTEVMSRELKTEAVTLDPGNVGKIGDSPVVILLTGVNGSGKTTVCGKLAKRFNNAGYRVLIVAADTFRAAAIDQLKIWAERAGVDFQGAQAGSDPSSVVFDGIQRAKSEGHEIVIIDTAGRLQNKVNLMNELGKIRRTVDKMVERNMVRSLLVIDSTTGQNAITQAEVFGEVADLDGIVLTKLDGTARGGVVMAIKARMNLPVVEVGVGESIDDLVPFDAPTYARSLLGDIAGDELSYRWRMREAD